MESEPVQANHTKDISKSVKAGFQLFGVGFLLLAIMQALYTLGFLKITFPSEIHFTNTLFCYGSNLAYVLLAHACFLTIPGSWRFAFLLLLPLLALLFIADPSGRVPTFHHGLFFWGVLLFLGCFRAITAHRSRLAQASLLLWILLFMGDLACKTNALGSDDFDHFFIVQHMVPWSSLKPIGGIRNYVAFAALIVATIAAVKMRAAFSEKRDA